MQEGKREKTFHIREKKKREERCSRSRETKKQMNGSNSSKKKLDEIIRNK